MAQLLAEPDSPGVRRSLRVMTLLDRADHVLGKELQHEQRDYPEQEPCSQHGRRRRGQCTETGGLDPEGGTDRAVERDIERRAPRCENQQRDHCGLCQHFQDSGIAELDDRQNKSAGKRHHRATAMRARPAQVNAALGQTPTSR